MKSFIMDIDYKKENIDYWTDRAPSYSEQNREELDTDRHERWQNYIHGVIKEKFPEKNAGKIKILDIGTGPGFFAIILSQLGYDVTAIDYTDEMLSEARENSKKYGVNPEFIEMDADALSFEAESFDVVISRNVTWNLPKPEKAFSEWLRVLADKGILLIFDANWYGYLFDEDKRKEYEEDRQLTEELDIYDEYIHTDISRMEAIAYEAPLSRCTRPAWDKEYFENTGCSSIEIDERVWEAVWTREEKINYRATPMFRVLVQK